MDPNHSPLSEKKPQKVKDLPRTFLLSSLSEYFGSPAPEDIVDCDYSLWRCSETGLEFCWPLAPGNEKFYQWISSFPSYYPGIRWEYRYVADQISLDLKTGKSPSLLDVGCGSGAFLQYLTQIEPSHKMGMDLNEPAIENCRKLGFHAICATIEGALERGLFSQGQFEVVTSFHCLEHVPDPISFMGEMVEACAKGGRIFVSTPASPLSIEDEWFDVLNHPPHHMTRWNYAAYNKLADLLGMQIKFHTPRVIPLRQAINLALLKAHGPRSNGGRCERILTLLRDIPGIWNSWQRLSQRAKTDPLHGSDVVLVEFLV